MDRDRTEELFPIGAHHSYQREVAIAKRGSCEHIQGHVGHPQLLQELSRRGTALYQKDL